MPIITIQLLEGRSTEQKRAFVQAVTDVTSNTLACTPEAVQVIIQDIRKEDWASGGTLWADK